MTRDNQPPREERASPDDDSSSNGTPSEDPESGKSRWWKRLRVVLQAVEAGAVLKQHDALAMTTRAFVIIGDAIFG
jgi:hypothetical protein